MRRIAFLLVVCALVAPAIAAKGKTNRLLTVITPVPKVTAPAHPHVNVIVRFNATSDGYVPDPSTFRARFGRHDITSRFRQIVVNGQVVGMRTELLPPQLHVGRRVTNRMRLELKSLPRSGKGPRIVRDVDKIRFRAKHADNKPPVAAIVPPSEVIFPDVPLTFDGTNSQDPELDDLTYAWDFGDGGTATDAAPTHVFSGGAGDTAVQLTVSDGAATGTDRVTLVECPAVDAGRTPGTLRVDGTRALELGAVAPGATGTGTLTVSNMDSASGSQVKVQMRVDGDGFTADPPTLDLGPGASAPVTVTFAPTTTGHGSGDVVVVGSAANRCAVHVLVHGYGGSAPGTGPTLAGGPLFYTSFLGGTSGIQPDGTRFAVDTTVNVCQSPNNGFGTGDFCVDDSDCAQNGGTCNHALSTPFFPVDTCSDGQGALYLMSDEGTYSDPNNTDNDLSVTVLRIDLDANGNRTGARVLTRLTSGTSQLACDEIAASDGGKLYASQFFEVDTPAACFRTEQEQLISIHKTNGAKDPPLLPRIDAAEGFDACNDDIDQVVDLNVSPDGLSAFASLEDGGLFQLRPSFRLITPDVTDVFQLHPDGDVVTVVTKNTGTTGLLGVYRISPQQAATGAVHLADLTPCATLRLPNNRGPDNLGQLSLAGDHPFALGPATPGSLDSTLLVAFVANGAVSGNPAALAVPLRVQGVAAFSLPAGTASCSTLGVIALDLIDGLTF